MSTELVHGVFQPETEKTVVLHCYWDKSVCVLDVHPDFPGTKVNDLCDLTYGGHLEFCV